MVEFERRRVNPGLELRALAREVRHRERLSGKGHVHHGRRVTGSGGEVDDAALGQHVQSPTVTELVFVDEPRVEALEVRSVPQDVGLFLELLSREPSATAP